MAASIQHDEHEKHIIAYPSESATSGVSAVPTEASTFIGSGEPSWLEAARGQSELSMAMTMAEAIEDEHEHGWERKEMLTDLANHETRGSFGEFITSSTSSNIDGAVVEADFKERQYPETDQVSGRCPDYSSEEAHFLQQSDGEANQPLKLETDSPHMSFKLPLAEEAQFRSAGNDLDELDSHLTPPDSTTLGYDESNLPEAKLESSIPDESTYFPNSLGVSTAIEAHAESGTQPLEAEMRATEGGELEEIRVAECNQMMPEAICDEAKLDTNYPAGLDLVGYREEQPVIMRTEDPTALGLVGSVLDDTTTDSGSVKSTSWQQENQITPPFSHLHYDLPETEVVSSLSVDQADLLYDENQKAGDNPLVNEPEYWKPADAMGYASQKASLIGFPESDYCQQVVSRPADSDSFHHTKAGIDEASLAGEPRRCDTLLDSSVGACELEEDDRSVEEALTCIADSSSPSLGHFDADVACTEQEHDYCPIQNSQHYHSHEERGDTVELIACGEIRHQFEADLDQENEYSASAGLSTCGHLSNPRGDVEVCDENDVTTDYTLNAGHDAEFSGNLVASTDQLLDQPHDLKELHDNNTLACRTSGYNNFKHEDSNPIEPNDEEEEQPLASIVVADFPKYTTPVTSEGSDFLSSIPTESGKSPVHTLESECVGPPRSDSPVNLCLVGDSESDVILQPTKNHNDMGNIDTIHDVTDWPVGLKPAPNGVHTNGTHEMSHEYFGYENDTSNSSVVSQNDLEEDASAGHKSEWLNNQGCHPVTIVHPPITFSHFKPNVSLYTPPAIEGLHDSSSAPPHSDLQRCHQTTLDGVYHQYLSNASTGPTNYVAQSGVDGLAECSSDVDEVSCDQQNSLVRRVEETDCLEAEDTQMHRMLDKYFPEVTEQNGDSRQRFVDIEFTGTKEGQTDEPQVETDLSTESSAYVATRTSNGVCHSDGIDRIDKDSLSG
ncbi:unnamed protein product [Protopolystoma xenopodis]|uniref:Uncharacterized protein n=1 Tax=Protopolystoma xenopodis TaxID=117903 RepID=A0A3S5ANS6_9PLAT|nr:unnamed protein product [Protopolystoma xenopodis]